MAKKQTKAIVHVYKLGGRKKNLKGRWMADIHPGRKKPFALRHPYADERPGYSSKKSAMRGALRALGCWNGSIAGEHVTKDGMAVVWMFGPHSK